MKDLPDYQIPGERVLLLLLLFGALVVVLPGRASDALPFDPERICRYSIDNIPRSISIRQGADIWFGYDLEKARVFQVWRAPQNRPGLIIRAFKAQSAGAPLFEEKTGEDWRIKIDGKDVPLTARYLGCIHNEENFELSWELSHPDGAIKLSERIATAPMSGKYQAYRELRIESLPSGASLVLPAAFRKSWVLTDPEGKTVTALTSSAWHQLSLP